MTVKLHQVLALEKGAKANTESAVTRAYHDVQKVSLFAGLTRVYTPKDADDRDVMPTERKRVQLTVTEVLQRAARAWTKQADLVATKDRTNQQARADVIVDGDVLLADVPVTTLLYLEKMLSNAFVMVSKVPTLDPEVEWTTDPTTGLFRSAPEETVRTKKVPKAFVKAPATERHPAQVEMFTEDVIVGTWQKTLFSGAMSQTRREVILAKIQKLTEAVKVAREHANKAEVLETQIGSQIFGYLFA